MLKESAPKCSVCGKILWREYWDKRVDACGRRLGRNPGVRRDGQWQCYMIKLCQARAKRQQAEKGGE